MSLLARLLVLLTLIPVLSFATPKLIVPEPLLPWTDWVLQDTPSYQCPFFYNNHQQQYCAWPSKLKLNLQQHQGRFNSHWQVFHDSYITLPGDSQHWPQNVSANNKPAVVIEHNKAPAIKLKAGYYNIQGDFNWDNTPDSLTIPANTGLISVRVFDKEISNPAIKNNQLWLKASDTGNTKIKDNSNHINLQVFRKITDTIPLQLTTILSLEVSGKQREIKLPHALLKGFIPINIESPLPTRLEADGKLLIQVRPGYWTIKLRARNPKQLTNLDLPINTSQWPDSEIWSFAAQTQLRTVEVEQVQAINPSQSNIPKQWKKLPAFLLKQGSTMHFKVIRRGDPEPEPNNLAISRQLWLDFLGTGYTVQDQINGKMTHGWRLDSLDETLLGHVTLNGQTQLITESLTGRSQGVELRKGTVQLSADSRIVNDIHTISSTGWQQKFNKVSAILHLPPGWHLLAVSGVDNVPGSWVARWTLLDLFLVLISALAVGRLWNNYWGIVALITLALIWHEANAPRFIWLNIIAAISLIKILPKGNFLKIMQVYRSASLLILLIICIPFLINQVRTGLYPQLEKEHLHAYANQLYPQSASDSITPALLEEAELTKTASSLPYKALRAQSAKLRSPTRLANTPRFKQIDPNANLQTGPGLPQWQWTSISLSWNGSVDSQQQIRFWYLNPITSLLLNFIRVILVIILALLMLDFINKKFHFRIPSLAINLCMLVFFLLPISPAYSDFPSPNLLNELKKKLLKAPDCLPVCAQISNMQLDINNKSLSLALQVHTQEAVAIPLPAKFKQWLPSIILVNNAPSKAIIRDKQGLIWIHLEAGIHKVKLTGPLPRQASFTLPLSLKPHNITYTTQHWSIEGLGKNGITEKQLHFTRLKSANPEENELQPITQDIFPAYIKVERTLHLGLDWHTTTRVIRMAKEATAITLKVPLLKGEAISSPNIRSLNGAAIIHMTANQHTIKWQSLLEKNTQLKLQASVTDLWTEVWRADISPIWHIKSTGISAIHHQDQAGNWLPTWRPWPGETVTLEITRPTPVKGQTLTIDKSILQITSGKRNQETLLDLDIRSSKGTQHTLHLPQDAQLESIKINGTTQPIRQQQQSVILPIKPGKQHFQLNWHETKQQSNVLTTSVLNLGIPNVNSHIKVLLGHDRWVLLTKGPQLGPAVLFWGAFIVLAILAFALGKSQLTPLKHWQWFLLLIGLSQIPLIGAIVVVAWLMALGLRKNQTSDNVNIFNLTQIVLFLLTLSSLGLLFIAVEHGLLGSPDMQILGNQSTAFNLNWYQDRNSGLLATATIISIPLTSYRILMLLWSLWLAISLLNWLKWGWQCFSYNDLWKKSEVNPKQQKSPL